LLASRPQERRRISRDDPNFAPMPASGGIFPPGRAPGEFILYDALTDIFYFYQDGAIHS